MAILSDKDIKQLIKEENAVYVEKGPELDEELQVGPSSIDLRLGYDFTFPQTRKMKALDTKDMDDFSRKQEDMKATAEEGVVVHPGEFVLGTTLETVNIPNDMVARIEGRSSYARLGLIPHAAGGFVDAGFEGQITLEIQNLGNVPITIYPEDRICQMAIETMTSEAENPYGDKKDSKYMGQKGATEARLDKEKR
ncbi:dCTP deaminase [Candidatus Nanohalovita haloferacivicina]|uniref:dCTP deaminase n=1 Tax=Candidatus Nanohalovita haloferacivicina TaxID=2978046 RepID=UPI00325FCCB7|nr:dCTP deaminase [Candidatus Nanohalobia archaeon BNXNv]